MAHVFDEQHDDPAGSGAVRLHLVRTWRQGLERTGELVAEAEEHLERLACDQQVVAALRLDDFEGPAWEEFTETLVAYAYQYLSAWIRSGLIVARCRDLGIWLPTGFLVPLQEEDVKQLTEEVLADAVVGFQELLRQGGWSAAGGATLSTYFVGQCITRFPNLYRAWLEHRRPASWPSLSDLDEDTARVAYTEHQIDPAEAAIAAVELQRVARQLDERTLHAVVLQKMGYSVAEVAELLGERPKAIEMALYHHRRRMREGGHP